MRCDPERRLIDDFGASSLFETDHAEWDGTEPKKAAQNDQL